MRDKLEWIIFFFILISSSYFFQGPSANVNSRFNLARALAEDHTTQIDKYAHNTIDKASYNGHYYSDKPPGLSFIGAVFLKATQPLWWALDLPADLKEKAQLYFLVFILLSTFTAWTSVFFFRFSLEILGAEERNTAFILTLICFAATLSFAYSTMLFSHQMAGNFLFIIFYKLRRITSLSSGQIYLLAFCIAFSGLIEYLLIPISSLAYLYLWKHTWEKTKLFLAVPGVAVLALFMSYNYLSFGSPWSLGYSFLQGTEFEQGMSEGFFGIASPHLSALYHLTLSSYRGIFYYNPIFIFSLIGIYYVYKNSQQRCLDLFVSSIFFYFLLITASYHFWHGGAAFGPRQILPSLTLFFIPIIFLPKKLVRNPLFYLAALLSYFYVLVATAVLLLPREEWPEPFWGYIFPSFKAGSLALGINEFSLSRLLTLPHPSSQAFNLGQLLGLTGLSSLAPLGFFQIFMLIWGYRSATYLTRKQDRHESPIID